MDTDKPKLGPTPVQHVSGVSLLPTEKARVSMSDETSEMPLPSPTLNKLVCPTTTTTITTNNNKNDLQWAN